MPTILFFEAFRIVIFTRDHLPPHVHALAGRKEASFYLDCEQRMVRLRSEKRIGARDLARLTLFLNENIAESEIIEAEQRWEDEVGCFPAALRLRFDRGWRRIVISLEGGIDLALDPAQFKALQGASDEVLSQIELWAAGYDLYFPSLDEDIYLPHVFCDKFPRLVSRFAAMVRLSMPPQREY